MMVKSIRKLITKKKVNVKKRKKVRTSVLTKNNSGTLLIDTNNNDEIMFT